MILLTIITAVIALSGFIAVLCSYKLNRFSPLCYGIVGAIWGWQLFMHSCLDPVFITKTVISWLLAPVLAFLLAAILYHLYRKTVIRSNIHYLKLLAYLRPVIIISSLLLIVAICINNGAVLQILNSAVISNFYIRIYTFHIPVQDIVLLTSVLIIFLIAYKKTFKTVKYLALRDNINIEPAVCTIITSSVILLLFSFPGIEITGLKTSPVSVSQTVFSSLLGINYIQNRRNVSDNQILRSAASVVVTPVIAFCISYLIFNLINKEILTKLQNYQPVTEYPFNTAFLVWIALFGILPVMILLFFKNRKQSGLQMQQKTLADQKNLFESRKAMSALEVKAVVLENESLNNKLELRRQELMNIALSISEQKEFLEKIYHEIKSIKKLEKQEDKERKINEIEKLISQKMNFSQEIESFYVQIEKVHKDFNIRLKEQYSNLTENEEKLITFLRLGFSSKHIASLMNIAPKSVEINRYRLRNKLGLMRDQKLINFIKSI
jgi:phosphate/sulfate permease/DNA-binding CsgD family transcriptional regulator